MNRSSRLPARARLVPLAAALVSAGLLLPVTAGSASAQEVAPPPAETVPVTPPADVVAPTFTVTPASGVAMDAALTVTFSEPVTGVDSGSLRLRSTPSTITPSGDGKTFVLRARALLYAGATYTVEAAPRILDAAGNAHVPQAVPVTVESVVDDRSAGMQLLGGWTRLSASGAQGGSYVRSVPTPTAWAVTNTKVYGKGVTISGCVGPGNGIAEIWADGRRQTVVDTYRPYTACGILFAAGSFPSGNGLHLLEVRGLGQKNRASKGTAIAVDEVVALP